MNLFFIPSFNNTKDIVNPPCPSKFLIPDWYKKIKPTPTAEDPLQQDLNLKNCIPFLDAMSSGYIQKTWADVNVYKQKNGDILVESDSNLKIFDVRNKVNTPVGDTFYNAEFVWQRQWSLKLPEGYSALISHPINRIDLPFFTLSAIVDSDQYNHERVGNIPFYIKNGFIGLIPKGTPMFQIIPFKREDWESIIVDYNDEDWKLKEKEKNKYRFGSYKKQFWQKKHYK